jgi:acyl-CoA synthetase (AMP-forming)/AMP-acid ligase II
MLYASIFSERLQELPDDHVICRSDEKVLTALELRKLSAQLALHLHKQGLRRGDHVLMASEVGSDFLVLFLALLHLRVKIALVDPHMGSALYKVKIDQFQPQWAFIDSRLLLLQEHPVLQFLYKRRQKNAFYIPFSNQYKRIATGRWLPLLQGHKKLQIKDFGYAENWTIDLHDDELVLVYTSGTLEVPKAVVHTLSSLGYTINYLSYLLKSDGKEAFATHLPHFALLGMFSGFETHFWKEELSAEKKIQFIDQRKITTLFGPPSEFIPLLEYCKKNQIRLPNCLQHLLLGSAPVLPSFLTQLRSFTHAKITCTYGMTENLLVSTVDGDEKLANTEAGDLLGKVVAGVEYQIAADGELLLRSPSLFKRYFHEDDLGAFHATGDLVREDESGRLYMMGRKKNMIVRGDKNIYPALYETQISRIKGVREAVMLGKYNAILHDEEVHLFVEADKCITKEGLEIELRRGKYAIDDDVLPDYIHLLELPRKGRQQKVDLHVLRKIMEGITHYI